MADNQNITNQEIPKGFCKCGCGEKTSMSKMTNTNQGIVKGQPNKFIHWHHARMPRFRGSDHHCWKGGKYFNSDGYPIVYSADHPRSKLRHVAEHIIIAEKALGRPMKPLERIHHHGPKKDQCLVICENHKYHMLLEIRTRAYNECGKANYRKCKFCKQWDDPVNLCQRKDANNFYHKACSVRYLKIRYKNKITKGV